MGDPSHRSVSVSGDADEAPARPWTCEATKPTIGSVGNIEAESPATELEASVTAFSPGSQMVVPGVHPSTSRTGVPAVALGR